MIKSNTKSKLTLWVADDVIKFGRRYSQAKHESLSQLFSDFLKRLKQGENPSSEIPPIIKNMTGVAKNDSKAEKMYKKHLEKKYL